MIQVWTGYELMARGIPVDSGWEFMVVGDDRYWRILHQEWRRDYYTVERRSWLYSLYRGSPLWLALHR